MIRIRSLPDPARIESLPSPTEMESSPLPPMRVLFPPFPSIMIPTVDEVPELNPEASKLSSATPPRRVLRPESQALPPRVALLMPFSRERKLTPCSDDVANRASDIFLLMSAVRAKESFLLDLVMTSES